MLTSSSEGSVFAVLWPVGRGISTMVTYSECERSFSKLVHVKHELGAWPCVKSSPPLTDSGLRGLCDLDAEFPVRSLLFMGVPQWRGPSVGFGFFRNVTDVLLQGTKTPASTEG